MRTRQGMALLTAWLLMGALAIGQQSWSVSSPGDLVTITIQLADRGGTADYPSGKPRLYYKVEQRASYNRTVLVNWSPMGILRDDQQFIDSLTFVSAAEVRTIEESYEMTRGKRRQCSNTGNELTLTFGNGSDSRLEVILRAYDNGAAFRYRFPESDGQFHRVTQELTGFALPEDARCWMMPFDEPTMYTPAYEVYYKGNVEAGTASPIRTGWAFPALYHVKGGQAWGLITESDLDHTYFGARLEREAPFGVYRIRMPDAAEGMGMGSLEPQSSLPWQTPWRVIMVAPQLSTIVESTLVTDLARPAIVEQTDWIRPGRVSWSWWSDQDSPQDCAKLKKFIDLAAEMKWEYSLIDANWTIMKNGTIHDLARYAKGKGVGLLLWYNSGGLHNEVSEKPRGLMFFPSIRGKEFELLNKWGVKGVKVDFFQSDKQNIISLYHAICKDAAEARIMVNFHGCTLPRGWDRTYPHLMSMESVRGEECYIFDKEFPEKAPWYNTVLAFTRNVVGPMDYTPVAFSDNRYKHLTTNAHELALSVVFESGWLHFADSVQSYRRQPGFVKDFLKVVPTTWDDTKLITGFPGKNVVLARRKENEWYVGGINGEPTETTVQVPLSFLAGGKYKMILIQDGNDARSFSSMKKDVSADDTIEVKLLPNGGFAMRFYKSWF